jgi:hypothetical protein
MTIQRGLEYNQMPPNACVLLLLMVICDCSDSDLLLQLKSIGITMRTTTRRPGVRQSLLLCSDTGRQPSLNSTQIAESHERLSIGPSEQRVIVQVTGSLLTIP